MGGRGAEEGLGVGEAVISGIPSPARIAPFTELSGQLILIQERQWHSLF